MACLPVILPHAQSRSASHHKYDSKIGLLSNDINFYSPINHWLNAILNTTSQSEYDICLEDDRTGDILKFNTVSGDYHYTRFGPNGFSLTGKGRIIKQGCLIGILDLPRVSASIDRCTIAPLNRGEARIRPSILGTTYFINDSDLSNNSCLLPGEGICVPVKSKGKFKQTKQEKLSRIFANNSVPSAMAGAFFHMARRYLAGFSPANSLEASAFNVFHAMSPALKNILACALQGFSDLSADERQSLFPQELVSDVTSPVTVELLSRLVGEELTQRASKLAYDNPACIGSEQPGRPRLGPAIDPGEVNLTPRVCRINGIRTNTFAPSLSQSDFLPEEFQKQCSVDPKGNLNCEIQNMDCPGNSIDGLCLRVPDVLPGQSVTMQGVNFFNVDARVRITAKAPGTTSRTVEAHVCGDISTPPTEIIGGIERVIDDCRVKDLITFKIPADLPVGIYNVEVIVPNNTGMGTITEYSSIAPHFINVLPKSSDTFQIASEDLICEDETNPETILGINVSDEVGINVITVPVGVDLVPGEMRVNNFGVFEDVDDGDERPMPGVLFRENNISGVAMSILGYEVDSRDAYREQIQSFYDAFVHVIKNEWDSIKDTLGAAISLAELLGLSTVWVTAIGAAIAVAVVIIVALWAPADLIIEDFSGSDLYTLATLTSSNFPAPPIKSYTSQGGIDVRIEPESKDVQYFERRIYSSGDSRYVIRLRYNRF